MNSWPDGKRHAMHQSDHEKWNENNYPGTLQLCSICEQPTGKCEEDSNWIEDEPVCDNCYSSIVGVSLNI